MESSQTTESCPVSIGGSYLRGTSYTALAPLRALRGGCRVCCCKVEDLPLVLKEFDARCPIETRRLLIAPPAINNNMGGGIYRMALDDLSYVSSLLCRPIWYYTR